MKELVTTRFLLQPQKLLKAQVRHHHLRRHRRHHQAQVRHHHHWAVGFLVMHPAHQALSVPREVFAILHPEQLDFVGIVYVLASWIVLARWIQAHQPLAQVQPLLEQRIRNQPKLLLRILQLCLVSRQRLYQFQKQVQIGQQLWG